MTRIRADLHFGNSGQAHHIGPRRTDASRKMGLVINAVFFSFFLGRVHRFRIHLISPIVRAIIELAHTKRAGKQIGKRWLSPSC